MAAASASSSSRDESNSPTPSPSLTAGPNVPPRRSSKQPIEVQKTVYTAPAADGSSHQVVVKKRKPQRHNENTLFGVLCEWVVQHQLGNIAHVPN
jgi:hypothetical protein